MIRRQPHSRSHSETTRQSSLLNVRVRVCVCARVRVCVPAYKFEYKQTYIHRVWQTSFYGGDTHEASARRQRLSRVCCVHSCSALLFITQHANLILIGSAATVPPSSSCTSSADTGVQMPATAHITPFLSCMAWQNTLTCVCLGSGCCWRCSALIAQL